MFFALPLLLAACACRVPAYDTAARAVELDFTRRADTAVLACTTEDFLVRLKVLQP